LIDGPVIEACIKQMICPVTKKRYELLLSDDKQRVKTPNVSVSETAQSGTTHLQTHLLCAELIFILVWISNISVWLQLE